MQRNQQLRIDQWVAIGLLSVGLLLQGSVAIVPQAYQRPYLVPQVPMVVGPHSTAVGQKSIPNLTATAFLVMDLESAAVLVQHQATQPLYPASTTKIITALVAATAFDTSSLITITAEDLIERSNTGFQVGDLVTVETLMRALLIQSDNAAAEILANHYPGGKQAFMAAMSEYARSHHLQNTTFLNPMGFDESTQLLSALDLAIVARELLKVPWLTEIVALPSTRVPILRQGKTKTVWLNNTNKLLQSNLGIRGIKTGTTPLAGEVLVTLATNQDHPVVIVVMNSQDRFADTKALLDFVAASYTWRSFQ